MESVLTSERVFQVQTWLEQHALIVIWFTIASFGLVRTVVKGEIAFRDGRYIDREKRPFLFWAIIAFFYGGAILVAARFAAR